LERRVELSKSYHQKEQVEGLFELIKKKKRKESKQVVLCVFDSVGGVLDWGWCTKVNVSLDFYPLLPTQSS